MSIAIVQRIRALLLNRLTIVFGSVRGEPVEPLCVHRVGPSTGSLKTAPAFPVFPPSMAVAGRTVLNIAGLIMNVGPVSLVMLLVGCSTTTSLPQPQRTEPEPVIGSSTSAPMQTPAPTLPPATPATGNTPTTAMDYGDEIALRAIALVGKPYRYGGADLQGFDCSGMVYFIHQAVGIDVPRTAAEQQQVAQHIDKADLQPGDLLFFRTTRAKRTSHVGVYVGENRFVHAPQSGKLIELRTLDDEYYSKRLVGRGRLYPNS